MPKQTEQTLQKANRALRMLSKCNEALLRATGETALLNEICGILVETGGYRLAWIGYTEQNEARSIRPVAWRGYETDYLEKLQLTWADGEREPADIAVRTGQPYIFTDIQRDPQCALGRAETEQRGYVFSIALPLNHQESTLGVLNIYAVEVGAFNSTEVDLLVNLADNLAHGLASLRKWEALQRSERQAQEEAALSAALSDLEGWLGRIEGMQNVCQAAADLIGQIVPDTCGYIWLWDTRTHRLRTAAAPSDLPEEQREWFFRYETLPEKYRGEALLSLQHPIVVEDAASDASANREVVQKFGVRSLLLVPLRTSDELLGLMAIARKQPGVFSEQEICLAEGSGQRIALALAGERAHANVQLQLQRISLLNQIARAIVGHQSLEQIFDAVLTSLREHAFIDSGVILLHDRSKQTFLNIVHQEAHEARATLSGICCGSAPVVETRFQPCLRGETVYIPDNRQIDIPIAQRVAQANLRSTVAVPLRIEGEVLGVLIADRQEVDAFSEAEISFLKQLGEYVALAAHQAHLYQRLREAYDELRETRQVMMQQERLRALGQMASGIVHDINNAISPISGYVELLLMREPNLNERTRRYLETIQTAAGYITNMAARMREFYRQRDKQEPLQPVDLNQVVKQTIEMTRPRWREQSLRRGITIKIEEEFAQNPPVILGMESELREALTNLIFNAVDAMPRGGRITIRTETLGNDALIEVADRGIGMDEEIRQHCLDPFFTTKGEDGIGLGLAMVYGTIQRHQGDIKIQSAPGQGTTVHLSFPLSDASVPVTKASSERPEAEQQRVHGLRILCIDDDPMIRKLLKEMLEGDGHTVVLADGGESGLAEFQAAAERDESFDVIFTDLGMPQVDGREVARVVKQESPDTPVILLTGWGSPGFAQRDTLPDIDVTLTKAPRLSKIRQALVNVLARNITCETRTDVDR